MENSDHLRRLGKMKGNWGALQKLFIGDLRDAIECRCKHVYRVGSPGGIEAKPDSAIAVLSDLSLIEALRTEVLGVQYIRAEPEYKQLNPSM